LHGAALWHWHKRCERALLLVIFLFLFGVLIENANSMLIIYVIVAMENLAIPVLVFTYDRGVVARNYFFFYRAVGCGEGSIFSYGTPCIA